LDKYRVIDVKGGPGKSGFGIVYICEFMPSPSFMVAIKSFQDKYFDREEVIRDFYHEAEVWVKLGTHRNIVRAEIVTPIPVKPHIILEYVDGGSLKERMNDGPLDFPEALSFAIQFCNGMIYANNADLGTGNRGIVHRDIKPGNIMLTKEGVVKITDFGLVKALGRPTVENPIGTPEYMSPEQFETMDVDQRSDIYSFGLVLFEMVFGRRPFPEPEDLELRWEHYVHCHRDIPPVIPMRAGTIDSEFLRFLQDFQEVVLRCLRKNPRERFRSFEELEKELREYQNRMGIKTEEWKREETRKTIESALFWGPDSYRILREGMSLLNLGKHKEALQLLDKALKKDPMLAKAWIGKALALGELGMLAEALECVEKALKIDPGDHVGWSTRGGLLLHLHRSEEALESLETALRLCPSDELFTRSRIIISKAAAFSDMGKSEEALLCCEEALKIDPTNSEAWYHKGVSFVNMEKYQEAIKCFKRTLEIDPDNANAWEGLGDSYYYMDRLEDALRCRNKALEIDPNDSVKWSDKGLALTGLGRYDEATKCYDRSIEIDPKNAVAWAFKGIVLTDIGIKTSRIEEVRKGLECLDKALKYNPGLADAWTSKGNALSSLGKDDQALGCFDKALEIEPRHSLAWYNKGNSLVKIGQYAGALGCYDRALEINQEFAEAWYNKGVMLANLGRLQEALASANRHLEINPASEEGRQLRDFVLEKLKGR